MAKVSTKAKPHLSDLVVYDVEQGSDEWYAAKLGRIGASDLSAVMAESKEMKMRTRLLRALAAETITEAPRRSFSNRAMDRGKEMEPEILDWYARTRFVDVNRTGFIWNPVVGAGWSPDALVGDEGAVEIKSTEPDLMIELLEKLAFPNEHRAQCQGGALWVGRRRWVDLVVYAHPKLPKYVARVEPDALYHQEIASAVLSFNRDLVQLVKRIKAMRIG